MCTSEVWNLGRGGGGRLGLFCPMFVTQERFLSLLFCVVF